jgi:RecJ-like exonuclease
VAHIDTSTGRYETEITGHKTCRRCKGSGVYGSIGVCFGCGGSGVDVICSKLTPEQLAHNAAIVKAERDAEDAAFKARRAAGKAAHLARLAARKAQA